SLKSGPLRAPRGHVAGGTCRPGRLDAPATVAGQRQRDTSGRERRPGTAVVRAAADLVPRAVGAGGLHAQRRARLPAAGTPRRRGTRARTGVDRRTPRGAADCVRPRRAGAETAAAGVVVDLASGRRPLDESGGRSGRRARTADAAAL